MAKRMDFLKDERGFTLTEILVTTIMMFIVLSALSSVLDMSLRAFSFGNDKVEATETARVALEKMEREIRQASAYTPPSDLHLFDQWTANQIRFGNDLNGNGIIECPTTPPPNCEKIGYRLNGTTLERDNSSAGTNFQPVANNVQSLTFTYYNKSGAVVAPGGTEATDPTAANYIDRVQVTLVVSVDRGIGQPATQTLTSMVDLRNR